MAVNIDQNFPPSGPAPYRIDRTWCLGDSLAYINANTSNFDSRIDNLSGIFTTRFNYLSGLFPLTSNFIAGSAITFAKMAHNSVGERQILDGSINGPKIQINSIPGDRLTDESIPGTKIQQFTIQGSRLATNSVSNEKIIDGSVTPQKLSVGSPVWTNTGNVGIGTNSPVTRLDIRGEFQTGNGPFLRLTNTFNTGANTFGPSIIFTTNRSGEVPVIVGVRQNDSRFYIAQNNAPFTEFFVVNSLGNVGIGTTNPGVRLDISGTVRAAAAFLNTTANRVLISDSSSKVEASSINTTELGHLAGITSNIQTQLNNLTNNINIRVVSNPNITGNTNTKITYDSKGLVTGGTNLVATDIPNLDTSKITTGTFSTSRIADSAITTEKINKGFPGNWYDKVAYVKPDGVIEAGRYIDFHNTNGDPTDFTYRIDNVSNNNLSFSGNVSIAGECQANIFNNFHGATTRNTDTVFYTSLNSSDNYIRKNTREGALQSLGIFSIIEPIIPSIANLRISPSVNFPVVTTDHDVTAIYIHPYNGSAVGLYNQSTARWEVYQLPGVITATLASLLPNTNYDIFLSFQSGTFNVSFVQWSNSNAGAGSLGLGAPKALLNGIWVRSGQPGLRYIGCLRTTSTNRTIMSFGANTVGGANCRHFIWNAQNRVSATAWSFEPGTYNATGLPQFGGWTGWRRVNPTSVNGGRNNRFSFIIGDVIPILVDMKAQLYTSYYANVDQPVTYSAMGINDENNPFAGAGSQMIQELRGSDMTPRAHLIRPFQGFNFIQCLENIMTGNNVTAIMNEGHSNQTGYLVTLEN